jgi:protein-tyrosine-phosphatase
MHRTTTNVLFVSAENACRSLLAEACLNYLGKGKLKAFSCGVPGLVVEKPYGWTLLALQTAAIPSSNLQGKPWTEFTRNGSPKMDFVVALDRDTLPSHPIWPGQPVTALWDYPHIVGGSKKRYDVGLSAVQTLLSLRRRIEFLVSLHARGTTRADLQHDLRDLSHV